MACSKYSKDPKFWFSGMCEFLGVMFLVLVACGSCAPYDNIRIGLVFGFTIAAMVWATAHISGGHLNPAVSTGFVVTRKMGVTKYFWYLACQIGGAITGAGILKGIAEWPYTDVVAGTKNTLCTSEPAANMSQAQTFGVELLITFVLVWTVMATVDRGRENMYGSPALAIGLAIAIGNFWAAPLTGAGMNPARVFGPAVVSGTWKYHWAYWVGPLIGGAVAGLMYEFLFAVNATPSKIKGFFTRDYNTDNYDSLGEREEEERLTKSGGSNKQDGYGATEEQQI